MAESWQNYVNLTRSAAMAVWVSLLVLGALGLAAGLIGWGGYRLGGPLWGIAVLAAIALFAERHTVRIGPSVEITVSVLPMLFAAVVYGPLAAMAVGAAGLLGDVGRPVTRWLVWTSLRTLSGGFAGIAASVVAASDSLALLAYASLAAVITEAVVDGLLGSITVAIRGTSSIVSHLRSIRPVLLAAVPLYAPVIALLAYAYAQVSGWSVLIFIAPALAAHSFYRMYREQREAAEKLAAANDRLGRANISFAVGLVAALEARDRYTAGHSEAVATYSRDIAARMGLSEEEQDLAHLCGLVHDIGKIGLPASLLEKPGALTLEERRLMESHSEIGERILSKIEDYERIATIVRHHHERVDGCGYPDKLDKEEIPLISRIIAVADAYDAMTSDRPYREAMPSHIARLRLAQAVESQFDTTVVAAFEAILATATPGYRSGGRPELHALHVETRLPLVAAVG